MDEDMDFDVGPAPTLHANAFQQPYTTISLDPDRKQLDLIFVQDCTGAIFCSYRLTLFLHLSSQVVKAATSPLRLRISKTYVVTSLSLASCKLLKTFAWA